MWQRCATPAVLKKQKCVLIEGTIIPFDRLIAPVYFGYARGCNVIVITCGSRKEKQPKPKSTTPIPPSGSHDEDQSTTHDTFVERFVEVIVDWQCAQKLLIEKGWNRRVLDWWHCEGRPSFPPKLKFRTNVLPKQTSDTTDSVLARLGIPVDLFPTLTEPWTYQQPIVRRFWRCVLSYMCGFKKRPLLSAVDLTLMSTYAREHLPVLLRGQIRQPLLHIEPLELPPAQYGFFSRLVAYTADFKRAGIDALWPPDQYAIAKQYGQATKRYLKYKYAFIPFQPIIAAQEAMLDIVCEYLWTQPWVDGSTVEFEEPSIWRVFGDRLETCHAVTLLEHFCPPVPEKFFTLYETPEGDNATMDFHQLAMDLYHAGFPSSITPYKRKKTHLDLYLGLPRQPKIMLSDAKFAPHWCEDDVIDPNWIEFEPVETILPQELLDIKICLPMVPCFSDSSTATKQLIMQAILDDQFYLRQQYWFRRTSLFKRFRNKTYFNSSYLGFSKRTIIKNLVQALELVSSSPTKT